MRRRIAVPLLAAGTVASTLAVAAPAQAHGYVSS
ncbi:cellulose-binding protein, partial [Micromonospora echinofusca]|nr:cellulose-binding protein [Micromonospora echinofusca]